MTYLEPNLTITGVLLVSLGALHAALPVLLQWNRELAAASMINREVSYVHCFFIGLACALWGLLPLTAGRLLLAPSPVTRLVLTGAVIFWACRLVIQLAVFNRHARESATWRALSIAGSALWFYLTAIWTWALLAQH
jgi:hypothetical protein